MNVRRLALAVGGLGVLCAASAAEPPGAGARAEEEAQRLVERFIGPAEYPRARVMLLGTFHFDDAGLDAFKPKHRLEILSEARQAEIADVVERLAKFAPTKIGVEAKPGRQGVIDKRYAQYREGKYELTANEIDQIGLRLAKKLDHATVHAIDAAGRWLEPRVDVEEYAKQRGQSELLSDPIEAGFGKAFEYLDERKTQVSIRESLLLANAETMIRAGHGVYLTRVLSVGDGEEYPGVDGFRTHWYNRNLRIFANIQRMTDGPEDRILIIIGAGHLPILRHAVECSPGHALVEVAEYLE